MNELTNELIKAEVENQYIFDFNTEYIKTGNLIRITIQATMVGIAVDGKGELHILPTGVHEFNDSNFKYYGSISSEQHSVKIDKLSETAGDSGEAEFDISFAYRIDIDDHESVIKVYTNLDKNSKK